MDNCVKSTIGCLVSTLVIAAATPKTAHAGTLTIYNVNCTKTVNFSTKQRVSVHVHNDHRKCTDEKVTVSTGASKTIELLEWRTVLHGALRCGKYRHEAMGTVGGKYNVPATGHSRVTCKKDWLGVCQCTKN